MGVVTPGPALIAEPKKREVMGVGPEAVLGAQTFKQGSKLVIGYLDRFEAELTHQVFVVVVQGDVPPS